MNSFDRLRLLGLLPLFPNSPDEPDAPLSADSPSPAPVVPMSPGAKAQIPKTPEEASTYLVFSDQPVLRRKPFLKKKDKKAPLVNRPVEPIKCNCRIGKSYFVFTINRTNRKEPIYGTKNNSETIQTIKEEVTI